MAWFSAISFNKSAWSCFRQKTPRLFDLFVFLPNHWHLTHLTLKKGAKRSKKHAVQTCISTAELEADPTEVLLRSLLSKAQVTWWLWRKGSLEWLWWDFQNHLVGSGFGVLALVHFLSDFVHFPLEAVENCYLFVWECFVVMCLFVYEKSRSEARADRIIQRWLIPCLLDSHSLMERGNVHITWHLICLTLSLCSLQLGEMAPQHGCSFVHVDVT